MKDNTIELILVVFEMNVEFIPLSEPARIRPPGHFEKERELQKEMGAYFSDAHGLRRIARAVRELRYKKRFTQLQLASESPPNTFVQ